MGVVAEAVQQLIVLHLCVKNRSAVLLLLEETALQKIVLLSVLQKSALQRAVHQSAPLNLKKHALSLKEKSARLARKNVAHSQNALQKSACLLQRERSVVLEKAVLLKSVHLLQREKCAQLQRKIAVQNQKTIASNL
jgi:hypothetical protein